MTFQPIVPLGGYAGWALLTRTSRRSRRPSQVRPDRAATDYFRDNIASVKTADDLIGDRRLLSVALKAFGLEDDINSKAFLRKVLSEGGTSTRRLANRLADKRYLQLAKAFGFGDLRRAEHTTVEFRRQDHLGLRQRQFEIAVGEPGSRSAAGDGPRRATSARS